LQKRTLFISRLAIILSLTVVIQIAGLPQPITGPLINAILFFTATLLGSVAGVVVGCLTPTVALIRGQLPMPFAPMVPFIALGNAVLVLVYYSFKKMYIMDKNLFFKLKEYFAILFAALAKFSFLYLSVKIVLPVLLNMNIPPKIVFLMSTPQLITAVVGGVLAIFLLKFFNKTNIIQT